MDVEQFFRKSFPVEAVHVSAENIEEVAKWCDGEIRTDEAITNPSGSANFIKVRVHNPLTERQTKAFVGDWVLYAGKGYKVYTDKAFRKSFGQVGDTLTQNVFEEGDGAAQGSILSGNAGANPGGTHTVSG